MQVEVVPLGSVLPYSIPLSLQQYLQFTVHNEADGVSDHYHPKRSRSREVTVLRLFEN